jgi:hypothetical protein
VFTKPSYFIGYIVLIFFKIKKMYQLFGIPIPESRIAIIRYAQKIKVTTSHYETKYQKRYSNRSFET